MIPFVPPEIWLRIGQFIPPKILRKLYAVNSLFFDLALNEKYSDINFAQCWTPRANKHLKHLKQPHIARRVKRLTVSSDWFQSNLCMTVAFLDEITSCMAIALCLPFGLGNFNHTARRVHNLRKCDKLMTKTVLKFPNILSLTIVDGSGASLQNEPSPFLVNAYIACASTLRVINLHIKTSESQPFPPNASALTSLEEVNLTFSAHFGCGAYPEATSKFLLAVAPSLVTLNVSFLNTFHDEPSQLLRSFSQSGATFPKLRALSLSYWGLAPEPTSNLIQFLNRHADTLKYLCLYFMTPSTFVFRSPDDLAPPHSPVLPQLETLELVQSPFFSSGGTALQDTLDTVRTLLQHSWNTLTTLVLKHYSFTPNELAILLDLLARGPAGNGEGRLKSLDITIQILTPQVLDMLADKYPQLEKLTIGFSCLRSNAANVSHSEVSKEDLTTEVVERFLLEMQVRSYSKWSLKSFGVVCDHTDPTTISTLVTKLALCMPRLEKITGTILLRKVPGGGWVGDRD